jgi:hypothetical protein
MRRVTARPCRVCSHGERAAIDKALLVIGQSPRRMARRYADLTRRALTHHRDVCLKDAVVEED